MTDLCDDTRTQQTSVSTARTAGHTRIRLPEIVLLAALLALAGYLRLANVAANPSWYTDEATHIDIAQHLLRGEIQYMAVTESTLLFAKLPLFDLLLAAQLAVAGSDADAMLILRTFTGTLGVLCVFLLYLTLRLGSGRWPALLAALALAVYPRAVVYSRFGFSYNLLAVLVLLAFLGLSQYGERRQSAWLVPAAGALGLGLVTDVAGFMFLPPFILIVLIVGRRRDLLWSVPLALAPFALYALVMLARAPEAFLFDLQFTFGRLGSGTGLESQWANLTQNLRVLLSESAWLPLGAAGLFLLRPTQLALAALALFWLPIVAVGRTVALYDLSAYYLIPLLPFVALGVATLFATAGRAAQKAILRALPAGGVADRRRIAAIAGLGTLLTLAALLWWPALRDMLAAIESGFTTPIDGILIEAGDARLAANYINANAQPSDTVITSPTVGWLLKTNVADYQMTAVSRGATLLHLPPDIAAGRWAFPVDLSSARYVVVEPAWALWGLPNVPGMADMLAEVERWPLAFESGDLRVYRNPAV